MRRRYRLSAPALAHWFGVRPWEIPLLTADEVEVLVAWIPKPKG